MPTLFCAIIFALKLVNFSSVILVFFLFPVPLIFMNHGFYS